MTYKINHIDYIINKYGNTPDVFYLAKQEEAKRGKVTAYKATYKSLDERNSLTYYTYNKYDIISGGTKEILEANYAI